MSNKIEGGKIPQGDFSKVVKELGESMKSGDKYKGNQEKEIANKLALVVGMSENDTKEIVSKINAYKKFLEECKMSQHNDTMKSEYISGVLLKIENEIQRLNESLKINPEVIVDNEKKSKKGEGLEFSFKEFPNQKKIANIFENVQKKDQTDEKNGFLDCSFVIDFQNLSKGEKKDYDFFIKKGEKDKNGKEKKGSITFIINGNKVSIYGFPIGFDFKEGFCVVPGFEITRNKFNVKKGEVGELILCHGYDFGLDKKITKEAIKQKMELNKGLTRSTAILQIFNELKNKSQKHTEQEPNGFKKGEQISNIVFKQNERKNDKNRYPFIAFASDGKIILIQKGDIKDVVGKNDIEITEVGKKFYIAKVIKSIVKKEIKSEPEEKITKKSDEEIKEAIEIIMERIIKKEKELKEKELTEKIAKFFSENFDIFGIDETELLPLIGQTLKEKNKI